MTTNYYSQLANTYRISQRAIATKAKTSQATVWKILEGKGRPFYTEATEKLVFAAIDALVKEKLDALHNLQGFTPAGDDRQAERAPKLKRK